MDQRIEWDDLSGPLKQAIEARTGLHHGCPHREHGGQNSPLAAIIEARDGKVFAKGLPSAHRQVITQVREAAVTPLVRDISPALSQHGTSREIVGCLPPGLLARRTCMVTRASSCAEGSEGYTGLSTAARSRMPTGIHAQARRAAARLAHEVSSTSCASLDPADLNSPMTDRSTW